MLQRTFWLCAVILGALLLVPGSAQAGNVLANPGFEDGPTGWGAAGWIAFNNVYTEDWEGAQFVPYEGNQLVSMFGNWWGVFNVSGMFQSFPTTPGQIWKLSAKSRHWSGDSMFGSQAEGGNWVVQKIVFRDAGNAEIGAAESIILDGTFATDVWHENAPIMAAAPAGAVAAEAFILYLQPLWDGGAAHIDNVEFGPVQVNFDIHPGSCPNPLNLNAMGVTPAALLGSADVDVHMIDYASLRLNGVAPLRHSIADVGTPYDGNACECNDFGPDGLMDMTLKFKTQDLVMALYPFVNGDVLTLTLTGTFLDGTPFSASDCMIVRGGPKDMIGDAPGDDVPAPDGGTFTLSVDGNGPVQRIQYGLAAPAEMTLRVYDVAGRLVQTLVQGSEAAGLHTVEWNAGDQPTGMYFIRLQTADESTTQKVVLLKK